MTQATPERAGWTSLGALRLRSPASGTLRVRAHSRVSPSHQRRRGRSKFFSGPACTVLQNHRKWARAPAMVASASEPEPLTEDGGEEDGGEGEANFLRGLPALHFLLQNDRKVALSTTEPEPPTEARAKNTSDRGPCLFFSVLFLFFSSCGCSFFFCGCSFSFLFTKIKVVHIKGGTQNTNRHTPPIRFKSGGEDESPAHLPLGTLRGTDPGKHRHRQAGHQALHQHGGHR